MILQGFTDLDRLLLTLYLYIRCSVPLGVCRKVALLCDACAKPWTCLHAGAGECGGKTASARGDPAPAPVAVSCIGFPCAPVHAVCWQVLNICRGSAYSALHRFPALPASPCWGLSQGLQACCCCRRGIEGGGGLSADEGPERRRSICPWFTALCRLAV